MLSGHCHVQLRACRVKLHKGNVVAIVAALMLVSCGSIVAPTASTTSAPTVTPTPAVVATPTPAPATTAAATVDELSVVASMVYPACTPANCAGDAMYTTCDASSSGPDVFAPCPLTTKLDSQLKSEVDGVASAPDPIGGGQDPEWLTESVSAMPSATGGVVTVTLGLGPGTTPEKYDLVVVLQGSQLLVDDIYCTGSDPTVADAFAAGWLERSVCTA
jgi:hypothetical protein